MRQGRSHSEGGSSRSCLHGTARHPTPPPAPRIASSKPECRACRSRLLAAKAGRRRGGERRRAQRRRRRAPAATGGARAGAGWAAHWAARLVGPLRDHEQAQQALLGGVQVRQQRALPARGAGPVMGRSGDPARCELAPGPASGPGSRAGARRAVLARCLLAAAARLVQPGPCSAWVPQAPQGRPCWTVRERVLASQRFPVLAPSAVVPHQTTTRDVAASGFWCGLSGDCRRPRALSIPSKRLQASLPCGAAPLPGSARQRGSRARRRAHLSASGSPGRLSASCRRPPYACSTTTSSTWRRSVSRSAPLSSGSCPAAIASTRRRPRSSTTHDYAMPRPQKLRQAWGLQY